MTSPSYSWPEDLFPAEAARSWLESELGGDVGPTRIIYQKQWGVTATFTHGDRTLIFKGSRHPAAAHGPIVHRFLAEIAPGRVPAVLAGRVDGDITWTVFEHIEGPPLEDDLDPDGFVELAGVFVAIQVAASEARIPDEVPRSPLQSLPDELDRFADSVETHADDWGFEDTPSPSDAAALLRSIRPRVVSAVEDLADAGWPDSIDHVDLNVSNALVPDGHLIVIDWEEAVVGFPAFSLDRILSDAGEHDGWEGAGLSPTGKALIRAYTDAIPWGDPADRETVVENAVRLNRIAFAGQSLDFGRAWDMRHGSPRLMAFCTDRILEAWTEGE